MNSFFLIVLMMGHKIYDISHEMDEKEFCTSWVSTADRVRHFPREDIIGFQVVLSTDGVAVTRQVECDYKKAIVEISGHRAVRETKSNE